MDKSFHIQFHTEVTGVIRSNVEVADEWLES